MTLCRRVSGVLVSVLYAKHHQRYLHPLRRTRRTGVRRAPGAVFVPRLARLHQQFPEPGHLHCVQCRISTSLPQPADARCPRPTPACQPNHPADTPPPYHAPFSYSLRLTSSSQSTSEILLLPVSENKRPPCWNSTSGSDFYVCIAIDISFCICLPNFCPRQSYDVISIFQEGGRQPYSIISRLLQTTNKVETGVSGRSSNFDSIGFIVSEKLLFMCYEILKTWHDVVTMSRMVLFGQNSAGRCRVICMPRLLDVHFEDAQTGAIHASKTANISVKTWQFTTSYKNDSSKVCRTETANITKDDITSQHSDISAMCCEVISSFVILAVLVLQLCCRRPYKML